MIAAVGGHGVIWKGLVSTVLIPAMMAPFIAGLVATVGTWLVYRLRPRSARKHAPTRASATARSGRRHWSRWRTAPIGAVGGIVGALGGLGGFLLPLASAALRSATGSVYAQVGPLVAVAFGAAVVAQLVERDRAGSARPQVTIPVEHTARPADSNRAAS